jgi:uncharacterized membrane protein YecN with MAPEG domain
MTNPIPMSTLFVGLNGSIAFVLSYIVVMERVSTRVWHGESEADVSNQPNYLDRPSKWAAFIEGYTQKSIATKTSDDGILQRKLAMTEYYNEKCELTPISPSMFPWHCYLFSRLIGAGACIYYGVLGILQMR